MNRFFVHAAWALMIALSGLFMIPDAKAQSLLTYQWSRIPPPQTFPVPYTDVKGILTFRGTNERSAPSNGTADMSTRSFKLVWKKTTGVSSWGGGAGWTGQPAIVLWNPEVRTAMNLEPEFARQSDFAEVIYASLDGSIYFLDLATGKPSRPPIRIGNPLKGSVSVDARGYPLLYVGEGIPEKGTIGFSLYGLTNQKKLFSVTGLDKFAYRKWGAFDGSALFNRTDDSLLVGGENGLIYHLKLNTAFEPDRKQISIRPVVSKYRYAMAGNDHQGIENSLAVYDHTAFFADNGGGLQALDLHTYKPVWSLPPTDDTDSSIVIGEEDRNPYLYTATEVDKQGNVGDALIRKIDGTTGRVVWRKTYRCFSVNGARPVNGGVLATPVLGKGDISGLVIFTIARYGSMGEGLIAALRQDTGEEAWRLPMTHYAWSSPVDVYDSQGKAYLVQADSAGILTLIDAEQGKAVSSINLGTNIEASPAVFGNRIVVASRGGTIFGLNLE